MDTHETIGIIGTGNYGIAIAKRLLSFGCFKVVLGSRKPDAAYISQCLNTSPEKEATTHSRNEEMFTVTSIGDAWAKSSKIVFFAVSARENVYESVLSEVFRNKKAASGDKVVIDISNIADSSSLNKVSNAERLNELLQKNMADFNWKNTKVCVVKGFNLINAYSMSANETKGNNIETIPIAGDHFDAKECVTKLCNKMGYQANDVGSLLKSSYLELANKTTFSAWYYPSLMSLLFVLFNFVWIFMWYFWFPKKPMTFAKYLNDFSLLSHLNKVLGFSSLQLLSFVYLGSVFASIYQLKNGTKYKRFPAYLDNWLVARKQFGLWAFLIATFHVITTIFVTNPTYLADWYRKVDDFTAANKYGLTIMTLNGEVNLIFGILAYLIMILVALSSINSIANSFSWSEWQFVQSKLGIACLLVGLLHGIFMYLRIYLEKEECAYDTLYLVTRVKLIALYFPALVLVLRFLFAYFSPLSVRIQKIRDGSITLTERKKEN